MNPLFLLSGTGMMALALVAVVYWKKRSKVVLALFLWGALAWVVGIVLKSVASIPIPEVMDSTRAILPRYLAEPILWLYIGLLTGIFECGVTLGFAHIRRIRTVDWREAVGYGLGFGMIEAFLLGAYSFLMILLPFGIAGLWGLRALQSRWWHCSASPMPLEHRGLVL